MKIARYLLSLAAILTLAGCSKPEATTPEPVVEAPPVVEEIPADIDVVEIEPGLTMRILRDGSGDVAQVGQQVFVHYTGWLYDPAAPHKRGAKFDSSVDRGEHFDFPLGAGRVIPGWDRGVAGMKVGEKRELTIAPELAYRDRDLGIIPPGSTLVFEVELAELGGGGPASD